MAQLHSPVSVKIMNVEVITFFPEQAQATYSKMQICFAALQISEEDLCPDFRTKLQRRLQPREANVVLVNLLRSMILDMETLRLVGFDDFVGAEV